MFFESLWLAIERSQRAWSNRIRDWCAELDDCATPIRALVAGVLFTIASFLTLIATPACEPAKPIEHPENPALYEFELTQCTANSDTLTASILCENEVRARHKRPPRKLPKPLPDGGVR